MKLRTGLHPERWHAGAWLLFALLVALALVLSHRATGLGVAFAEDVARAADAPPEESETSGPPERSTGEYYVAEVVDSLFFVPPAGFLALDLPRDPAGAQAVHLSGSVTVRGRGRDIQLRLFRAKDYDAWLHPTGGRKGESFWTSKRIRTAQLDLPLPAAGGPFVLLLDNGYSIRTPKHVSCQLQLQYRRGEGGGPAGEPPDTSRRAAPRSAHDADNPVTPRDNVDDEIPPPPPPPPSGY